jgi:hypothetical protein
MTDRELLEKAAKAAGFEKIKYDDWPGMDVRHGFTEAIWNGEQYWNPLADDGDAFRLAVKLGLLPSIFPGSTWHEGTTMVSAHNRSSLDLWIEEMHGTDPYAATRRAIVRAAAAIEGDQ